MMLIKVKKRYIIIDWEFPQKRIQKFAKYINLVLSAIEYNQNKNRKQKKKKMASEILINQSPSVSKYLRNSQRELSYSRVEKKWILLKRNQNFRNNCIRFMNLLCGKYNFNKDTLFLAIHILDQLIEMNFEGLYEDFEIIGGVLVLLTTKYNEVYPVSIDQICMVMERFYSRSSFFDVEARILMSINFEMPENTIYSRIYNQLGLSYGKNVALDFDKENDGSSDGMDTDSSEKDYSNNGNPIASKTLKVIKEVECLKYGEQILFHSFSIYMKKQQLKGAALDIVKINYIGSVLKRLFEGEKKSSVNGSPKIQSSEKKQEQKKVAKKSRFYFF